MFSKQISSYVNNAIIFVSLLFISISSVADEVAVLPSLVIKPTQCVSLRQGQSCFVNVDISWQVEKTGAYCLYSTEQNTPLKCWSNNEIGHFTEDLEVTKNITFTLKSQNDDRSIVSAVLELAWVYKTERLSHSSWRVF